MAWVSLSLIVAIVFPLCEFFGIIAYFGGVGVELYIGFHIIKIMYSKTQHPKAIKTLWGVLVQAVKSP